MRLLGIVGHDVHAFASEDVTAVVRIELDRFLRHHRQVASLVVRGEEFVRVVALVDVFPAATICGLHEDRKLQVIEHLLPVDPPHVAKRFRFSIRRVLLMRQQNRSRNCDADRLGHQIVEELVVGRPPYGVIDDAHAGRHRAFQIGSVEGDLVADPVENHVVVKDSVILEIGNLHGHRFDAIPSVAIDCLDQRPWERVFHSEQQSDSFLSHRDLRSGGSYRIAAPSAKTPCIASMASGGARPLAARWSFSGSASSAGR